MTQSSPECKNARVDFQDFTTDDSMAFLHLLKEANALPDWLVSAPEAEDVSKLPDIAFADTHRRKMPIHSKSAAFLSCVSCDVYDYPVDSAITQRLQAACHRYGITDLVKQAHQALAPEVASEKQASELPKVAYALEIQSEPGSEVQGYYPIDTPDQIEASSLKLAADLFAEKLPATWLSEAAEVLVKAAKDHGMKLSLLPATVLHYGEERKPSPEYLDEQIERRIKQASLPAEVSEIYKEAALSALEGESAAMDAAHVWELADRKFGVRYTDTVAQPAIAFRSGISKAAFEKLASAYTEVAGITIPYTQLQALPDNLVAAVLPLKVAGVVFSARAVDSGVKAASIIAELPEDDQLKILQLLTNSYSG
ncbi:MAG: hypothetical protein E6R03_16115 [Hyphomicrobiaceae bacterium]|nr:MAG: hypothetical protein E6R03_16115 [Hyphomicrobiaceae bacterium]